jgi:photosystem II stability/assembly factor-like uncharacterized protein
MSHLLKVSPLILLALPAAAQTWVMQDSGSKASLRGLSAATPQIVWASGAGGAYLVTEDGGQHWKAGTVAGAEALDFRDVHAVDRQTAYLLASGEGDKSRIYKSIDGGAHWELQLTNPDAKGFLDALAFWDARRGIAMGDPVGGRFSIFTTEDGGEHWRREIGPAALANEGAFAASGTCLVVRGTNDAWFASGGTGAARVFHSADGGRTWTASSAPIRNDAPSAGVFSLAFQDAEHGVAVGGDYAKPGEAERNIAVTADGGRSWSAPKGAPPAGFRSAAIWVQAGKFWIAVGTSGADISNDGQSWKPFDSGSFNAVAFAADGSGWAAGAGGRIARFRAR